MGGGALALIGFENIEFLLNTLDSNSASVSGGGLIWTLPSWAPLQSLYKYSYVLNCTFTGNSAGIEGGAMHISANSVSDPSHPSSLVYPIPWPCLSV